MNLDTGLSGEPVAYEWRGNLGDVELEGLHARAFDHAPTSHAWTAQLAAHSLGWVTARDEDILVGFVNVAWDGAHHAFLLDTVVNPECQGRGIGEELVRRASEGAIAAGCRWLHVDFEEAMQHFYVELCGFQTDSGWAYRADVNAAASVTGGLCSGTPPGMVDP